VPLLLARGASLSRTRAARKPKPSERPALAESWRRLYFHAAPPRTRSPARGRDRHPSRGLTDPRAKRQQRPQTSAHTPGSVRWRHRPRVRPLS
jgi:hypothetical protein